MLQDNKTVEQIVDDMTLFDDDLMSMVFDGNVEATGLLLKIVLKREDVVIISVVGQSLYPFITLVFNCFSNFFNCRRLVKPIKQSI